MVKKSKNTFKKDKYSRARGGTSVAYDFSCSKCSEFLLRYQKDGTGSMLRLYLDRIIEPLNLAQLQNEKEKGDLLALKCTKCGILIGSPMVYAPENRLAFRLIRGTFKKVNVNI